MRVTRMPASLCSAMALFPTKSERRCICGFIFTRVPSFFLKSPVVCPKHAKRAESATGCNPALFFLLEVDQAQRDLQGLVDSRHQFVVQMSDFIGQPLFVDRA